MLEKLIELDTRLFLYLNGKHHAFLDPIMYWASAKWFWIPFYLLILVLCVKTYKKRCVFLFAFISLLITVSDQVSSSYIKQWTKRLRPSRDPAIMDLVHLSEAGPGGMYGFVSGHATNSFALFVFLSLILTDKFRWLKYILGFWAVLIAYSRIYVGVHYPGDVICGALLGTLTGFFMAKLYEYINSLTKTVATRKWQILRK